MDWFTGKSTGNPYDWWWKPWFPVLFPFNPAIERPEVRLRVLSHNPWRWHRALTGMGFHWRRGLTDGLRGRFKRPGGMEVKHIWAWPKLRIGKIWGIRSFKRVACPQEYEYGGVLELGYPPIIYFRWVFHFKPSILGMETPISLLITINNH